MAAAEVEYFRTLENITPESIERLLLKGYGPKWFTRKNPVFIYVIGAPGVGKTTQTRRFLEEDKRFGDGFYEDLYNISLDTIVERIKPFRNYTHKLYNSVKKQREQKGETVTTKNYAKMSAVYLTTIMSRRNNFSLPSIKTVNSHASKIVSDSINVLPAALPAGNAAGNAAELPEIRERARTNGKSINDDLKNVITNAIEKSYNILYDTTLNGTTKRVDDYIKLLRSKNYKIIMIHITATAVVIKQRLQRRHNAMIAEGYLRAISPSLIQTFIDENKTGYEATQKKYPEIECISIDNNKQLQFAASPVRRSPTKSPTKKRSLTPNKSPRTSKAPKRAASN